MMSINADRVRLSLLEVTADLYPAVKNGVDGRIWLVTLRRGRGTSGASNGGRVVVYLTLRFLMTNPALRFGAADRKTAS